MVGSKYGAKQTNIIEFLRTAASTKMLAKAHKTKFFVELTILHFSVYSTYKPLRFNNKPETKEG